MCVSRDPESAVIAVLRGNLDNWDSALVDDLTATRRVITFDDAGVGGSSGTTPHVIRQMAHDAIEFIAAMSLVRVDILGLSIARARSGNSLDSYRKGRLTWPGTVTRWTG